MLLCCRLIIDAIIGTLIINSYYDYAKFRSKEELREREKETGSSRKYNERDSCNMDVVKLKRNYGN